MFEFMQTAILCPKKKLQGESCWKIDLSMLSKCDLYSEPAIEIRVKNVHSSNVYSGKMGTAQMSISNKKTPLVNLKYCYNKTSKQWYKWTESQLLTSAYGHPKSFVMTEGV